MYFIISTYFDDINIKNTLTKMKASFMQLIHILTIYTMKKLINRNDPNANRY